MNENTRLLKLEELREIAERERKATPGPWNVMENGFTRKSYGPPTVYAADDDLRYIATCADSINITPTPNLSNAEFIAASRTDIPRLLAHIEAQQAQLSSLCPIGDLDVITSLQTEKTHMAEYIKAQQAEIERLKNRINDLRGTLRAVNKYGEIENPHLWRLVVGEIYDGQDEIIKSE